MPDNVHRARPGARARTAAVVVALVLLLGTASVAVAQMAGDGGSERAEDSTGQAPTPPSAVDDLATEAVDESSDDDADDADEADAAAADDAAAARERRQQRRVDTVARERSKALGQLVELAEEKAEKDARAARRAEAAADAPFSVVVGSFNVLGSQHTAPGGSRGNFPPASVRSVGAANHIAKHGVDIVGMQELQDDQLAAIQGRTGLAAYPGMQWGAAETDNSILYDSGRFEFVSGDRFIIPFMGRPRPQPILRLRERTTGREFYVVNTHPSAHDGRYLVERRQGHATLVSVVNDLKQSGLPVLVTGDMNDREIFYCNVVPQAGLTASNGGSYSSGCQPPPQPIAVDWVVGSGVTWSGYWRDTAPVTTRISDHFFISATASFGPAAG